MKIRLANHSDIQSIRELWFDCFHDPYDYIDFFIEYRFNSEHCVVMEDGDQLIGMIHLLPCNVEPEQKALYWYAAGIRTDYRNRGLFKKFAEYVKKGTNDLGISNLCVPAEGLERLYRSLGFTHAYTAKDLMFTNESFPVPQSEMRADISEANPEDFFFLKRMWGDTVWTLDAIQYAIDENKYCEGRCLKIISDGKIFCCFAIKKDNCFLIDNHNMSIKDFDDIKGSLFNILNCQKIVLRINGDEKTIGLADTPLVKGGSKISMTLA